jgi:hypothetical protein
MHAARAPSEADGEEAVCSTCPSAQADEDAIVMGVVGRRHGAAAASMLPRQLPLEAIAHLLPPSVPVTDMVRLGAPCAERRCGHFADGCCGLAARIVAELPEMAEVSPCSLRPSCRWWRQEGAAVCRRCAQITDEPARMSELLGRATSPAPARSALC